MDDNGELQVGAIIGGKYRIDRVLGQGGMGIVYAATHVGLEQRVALKFLLRAAAAHPQMVERFAREARAAVRIQSEHVARVLDVGTVDPGIPYIVMEYLEGDALDDLLRREGRLSVTVAVDSILQACQALAEAHSLGIVHRDIKPANLFRARRPGRSLVKVLDFGICKVPLTVENIGITADTAMMGSPGYMSPEQFYGAANVDVRADVWALGAVLYEMLSGHPPFLADSMPALITQVLHVPHTPLASVAPDVPPELGAIIDACLQKEPAHRPANVAELARALAPFGPPGSVETTTSIAEVLGLAPAPTQGSVGGALSSEATARTVSSPSFQSGGGHAPARHLLPKETTLAPMTAPPSVRSSRRATIAIVASIAAVLVVGGAGLGLVLRRNATPQAGMVARAATTADPSSSALPAPVTPPSSVAMPTNPAPGPPATVAASDSPPEPKPGPGSRVHGKPRASASASASASAAPPEPPKCHLVASLDDQGNQHFVKVCE